MRQIFIAFYTAASAGYSTEIEHIWKTGREDFCSLKSKRSAVYVSTVNESFRNLARRTWQMKVQNFASILNDKIKYFISAECSDSLLYKFETKGLFISAAQKIKFSIRDFFSKCDQICGFLRIRSHLLKKSSMKNFIFCAVLKQSFSL